MTSPLAYVFWHQPADPAGAAEYEKALLAFHRALADVRVQGLIGSRTVHVPALPWLPGGGYEDWYLVAGFADLETLGAAAVDSARAVAHDAAARRAASGTAGLYRLVAGTDPAPAATAEPGPRGEVHTWFAKPAGMTYPDLVATLGGGPVWQRQLTLGPAPEFVDVAAATDGAATAPPWPDRLAARAKALVVPVTRVDEAGP